MALTFSCGNGNTYHCLGAGFSMHKGTMSAFKNKEFVSDRISHLLLKRLLMLYCSECACTEDKCDDLKDSFYEEPEHAIP
jgi:hypothetical protein